MRRASAISALTAIVYSLIAPLAFADPEANLPACCRRNGAHHCSTMSQPASPVEGVGFRALHQVCPACPSTTASASDAAVALLHSSGAIFAGLPSQASVLRQAEAHYRVSFSRSRQKRGPPVVLS